MKRPKLKAAPYSHRVVGWLMVGFGVVVLAAVVMVPIPAFDDLSPRPGILVAAERERYSPCRSGDCTRTIVAVRHDDGEARYHFGDAALDQLEVGAPITVWTYPEFRGFHQVRAWHAEQDGRVIRDHARLARSDRRTRLILVLLVPALFLGGGWLVRTADR